MLAEAMGLAMDPGKGREGRAAGFSKEEKAPRAFRAGGAWVAITSGEVVQMDTVLFCQNKCCMLVSIE